MTKKVLWGLIVLLLCAMPVFAQETDRLFTAMWSLDGQYLAVSYESGIVEIQEIPTQKIIQRFDSGHVAGAVFAWSPDGQRLVTGGWGTDQGVRIWDVATGKTVAVFDHLGNSFNQIAWDITGTKIIAASLEAETFIWSANLSTDTYTLTDQILSPSSTSLVWNPDNTSFLMSFGAAYIFDGTTYEITSTCKFNPPDLDAADHRINIFSTAWHPDGQSIACGTDDGRIAIWDIEGNFLYEVAGTSVVNEIYDFYGTWVGHLSFNQEGTQLMSIEGQGILRIWETETYTLLQETVLPGGPFIGFGVSPDRSRILLIDEDDVFTIIDTPDLTFELPPSTPLTMPTSEAD